VTLFFSFIQLQRTLDSVNYLLHVNTGSKIKHFKSLHRQTGIPYSEMLFFDDEHRNVEVEKLGVTFHHVPRGLTFEMFEKGLEEWRRRQSSN